jgi:chromosome segregation ATPase
MTENEQIVALTTSLLEMQKRYFALKDAFDSCAKTMTETREKNDALEKLNKSYFSEWRDAETQVDDLRSLINEKNKYIEELENKNENLSNDNEELENKLATLQEVLVRRDEDIDDYKSYTEDQQHQIEELEKEVEYWQDKYERDLSD